MFTVYYSENDTPDQPRIGMVSAPNAAIARRIAETQFAGAIIHKIIELTPPESDTRYPGARFINGEFRPVVYADDFM